MGNYILIKDANFAENVIVERVTIIDGVKIFVEGTDGGTVRGGGRYTEGSQVTLIATADAGYVLSHWTKDGVFFSYASTLQIIADESAIYKAVFIEATNVFNPLTARRNYGYNSSGAIVTSNGFIMSDFIDISSANKVVWSGLEFIGGVEGAAILSGTATDTGGNRTRNTDITNTSSGEYPKKSKPILMLLSVYLEKVQAHPQKNKRLLLMLI